MRINIYIQNICFHTIGEIMCLVFIILQPEGKNVLTNLNYYSEYLSGEHCVILEICVSHRPRRERIKKNLHALVPPHILRVGKSYSIIKIITSNSVNGTTEKIHITCSTWFNVTGLAGKGFRIYSVSNHAHHL